MKYKLLFSLLMCPIMFFSQKEISDYFNNRIDFVLDNEYGREFMGGIVTDHFKTDSTNHFFNKMGILPFYKYTESKYFDKKYLRENKSVITDKYKSGFEKKNYSDGYRKGIDYEFYLGVCKDNDFEIYSNGHEQNAYMGDQHFRTSDYKFSNFYLSSSMNNRKSSEQIDKKYYSNVALSISGINIFEAKYLRSIIFFNTLGIDYAYSEKNIKFLLRIYETIGHHPGRLTENNVQYLDGYPDVLMRKVEITGNKEEAIKYLIKNKLDYNEIKPEDYKEENFKEKR